MAYRVTLLVPIFKLLNLLVASLLVFHPTNVQPDFVAVGVKSMASPSSTMALVLVADVPPF